MCNFNFQFNTRRATNSRNGLHTVELWGAHCINAIARCSILDHHTLMDRIVYHTLLISHLSKFMALKKIILRDCWRLLLDDSQWFFFYFSTHTERNYNLEYGWITKYFPYIKRPKNNDVIGTYLSANRILSALRALPQPLWMKQNGKKEKFNVFKIARKKSIIIYAPN